MPRKAIAQRLPLDEPILRPSFRRERRALNKGISPVAGCDEAGRGPLAGPVVAAAVILDPKRIPRGLNDSKRLDAAMREKLYDKICASAQVAVAFGTVARIDRDNILRASLWALERAVRALPVKPRLVFVDGNHRIDCGCDCEAVVSGDALVRRSSDRIPNSLWRYKAQYIQRRNKSYVPTLPQKTFYPLFNFHKGKRKTDRSRVVKGRRGHWRRGHFACK